VTQPELEPTEYVYERAEIMRMFDCKVARTSSRKFAQQRWNLCWILAWLVRNRALLRGVLLFQIMSLFRSRKSVFGNWSHVPLVMCFSLSEYYAYITLLF